MRWSIRATAATTINGIARQCRLVVCRRACRSSKRAETTPISTASITARAVVAVNKLRSDNPIRQTFLQAAQEAQFRIARFQCEITKLGIYQVTQRNGERWRCGARLCPSAHGIARQSARRTQAQATRILFEGKRAVGVEYRQGKELKQIRARREVIVASARSRRRNC